jgi:hypothetical protein
MKKSLLFLLFVCTLCFLNACSGGSSAPPPLPLSVNLSPNAAQALDVNQSIPITANVSNDSSNQGVRWTITCPAGVNPCGALAQSKTASGTQNRFTAPANASTAEIVTLTATAVSDPTKFATIQVAVNPALSLVNPPPVQQQIATAGTPFSLNLMNLVRGGTAPFTWSITSGALPSGLTLNAATGMISGTPSAAAPASAFTLSCTDSGNPPTPLSGTLELSLTINAPGALAITSGAPPDGTVGGPYGGTHTISGHSFTGFPLTATGGTPSYTWSWAAAQGSSLPPGLNLSLLYISGGSTRCCVYVLAISGTPTTAGTYNVVVTIADSASPPAHVSANYTINVAAQAALSITSSAPLSGTVGVNYGPSSIEYLKCIFFFYRTWQQNCTPCSSYSACASLIPCTFQFPEVCRETKQVFLGFPFVATGGLPPYNWALASSSALPPGLSLTTGGLIAGTPTMPGTYNISVTVSDSASPPAQASANYKIVIAPPPPPLINAVPLLPIGTQGSPYVGFTFTAAGGEPPLVWTETGPLPQGMSFSPAGVLSGTPSAAGSSSITVTTQDVFGQDSAPLACTIQVLAKGFSPTGNMTGPRAGHTATLLTSGRVLVAGGSPTGFTPVVATAELFDPANGAFSPTGSMATARASHTSTLLTDGRVLVTGGRDATDNPNSTAEIFDPASGSFSATGSMESPRLYNTATLLKTGKVLVTGGLDISGAFLATAELYDSATGVFTPTGNMATARAGHTATLLNDGKVLVAGGDTTTAEIFDPATGVFTPTGNLEAARVNHTATLLTNGKVLVTGGQDNGGITLATADLFDPALGAFTPTGNMETVRTNHTAVLLNDGTVLVAGGSDSTSGLFLSSAELFNSSSGSFTPTADMTAVRASHAATLLKTGIVLVTGGQNSQATLASAELYQ